MGPIRPVFSFATKSAGSPELDFVRRHELNVKPKTPVAANLEPDRSAPNSGQPRRFRSLQAIYLKPLKRQAPHGVRTCDLQLRSYSVRNVEFFADFALRVAYYLGLPASGPVPLPRIVERWTVPRSNFIFKKSQENFERITLRRLIQIKDGQPEVMELWLAYLRKHQYYGVGMKANVWQFDSLGMSTLTVTAHPSDDADQLRDWSGYG
ncbi:uncharacterized protein KY384_003660 [Bacidia gigantensis]|uniref:uncharacterized protein n=1 Tax=Bacidia gigantensis TaxID=2732470 RepID=UPI001D03A946|nr:uncharacterized protein KY384_003660 [Bacidia gigantensis]KAG8532024.1 hypothetical protein KY384_003660 [Bacidia gigantensis]